MSVHFQREIDKLKRNLLSLCAVVDEQVQLATRALLNRDEQMARQVRQRDAEVDRREVEIEEECLKILALYQPVAVDLRFIVAALKINNDLERIGDLAVNIARKAQAVAPVLSVAIPFDLAGMADKTQAMLRDSLSAMVNMDAELAKQVCGRDDEVDGMKGDIRRQVEKLIAADASEINILLRLLAVSRNLERIADLATNISEDVIYLVDGEIARHQDADE
jgi:phosphate transport system protein